MSKSNKPSLTAEKEAFLDRIAATPRPNRRHQAPTWHSLDTAEALFDEELEGEDLDEAFAALPQPGQSAYVDDLRHVLAAPCERFFV